MDRFSFPIPGLGQTFVVPSVPDVPGWDYGPGRIRPAKRLKRQAEKKRKKLHRKQGRH